MKTPKSAKMLEDILAQHELPFEVTNKINKAILEAKYECVMRETAESLLFNAVDNFSDQPVNPEWQKRWNDQVMIYANQIRPGR